jgi:hypothetical protein
LSPKPVKASFGGVDALLSLHADAAAQVVAGGGVARGCDSGLAGGAGARQREDRATLRGGHLEAARKGIGGRIAERLQELGELGAICLVGLDLGACRRCRG